MQPDLFLRKRRKRSSFVVSSELARRSSREFTSQVFVERNASGVGLIGSLFQHGDEFFARRSSYLTGNATRPLKPKLVRQCTGTCWSATLGMRRRIVANDTWPSMRASAAPKPK